MRKFGPTNRHGSAFTPKKWSYQKEDTGMESSKLYCPSRCRYRTYQCVAANYSVSCGGSIGSRMEICGNSALPIAMVVRLHQIHGYIKRKLRAWRVQNCIALVGADTVLTSAWPQTTPCHGGSIGSRMEICGISGLPIPMVPCLHKRNGYNKRKLRAWRVQKCIALVRADTVLTSAWPQTTPCHGG